MIKTMFLVPTFDNRGRPFPRSFREQLEERLLEFGGFSALPGISGVWRAGDRIYRDVSDQYAVSLQSWKEMPRWLEMVAWVQWRFRQEAIYVEVAGVPEILDRDLT
jgi:hypothetical protein